MNALELKNMLIEKISAIDDVSFLEAIHTILKTKSEPTIYKTTPEQKANIQEGIQQIEKGNYYTNEQVESEVNKWLKDE